MPSVRPLNINKILLRIYIKYNFLFINRCGYVLQPDILRDPNFNPYDPNTFNKSVEPLNMRLTVSASILYLHRCVRAQMFPLS